MRPVLGVAVTPYLAGQRLRAPLCRRGDRLRRYFFFLITLPVLIALSCIRPLSTAATIRA
jgi:hypothetical protein